MPDFGLTPDYEDLRNTVAKFAHEVVAPVSAKYDEENFPYDVVSQMAEMGLFGLPFPEEFGGMGGDYFALVSRSRSSAASIHPSPSPSRPPSPLARCRSIGSEPRSRSAAGCRT